MIELKDSGNRRAFESGAVRDMAEQAEEVVVLTESEKFARRGVVPLHVDDKIRTIVSDGNIPADVRRELEARGVEILLARM